MEDFDCISAKSRQQTIKFKPRKRDVAVFVRMRLSDLKPEFK